MFRHIANSWLLVFAAIPTPVLADCVILLHGLARTSNSMEEMAKAFNTAGYQVANVSYPSREATIEELAPAAIEAGLEQCPEDESIHFVTHSLGGILVRYYLEQEEIQDLGKVVMLAPPNQGSQVTDKLRDNYFYQILNGPAGDQLGTDEDSLVMQLGVVDFPLGIIAGTKSVNPLLSQLLPNPDDGKVSVENTKVEGMTDFVELPHSHTFMMRAEDVIEQAIAFIQHGAFDPQE